MALGASMISIMTQRERIKMIKIYTDGSTRKNGTEDAPGAWGFVAVNEKGELVYKAAGGFRPATNQKAELMAAIQACQWAAVNYDSFTDIQIISDSAYLINCVNQKWYEKWQVNNWRTSKNGDVQNIPLWKELIPFFDSANYSFVKVKGHASDKWNCVVDGIVQEITRSMI